MTECERIYDAIPVNTIKAKIVNKRVCGIRYIRMDDGGIPIFNIVFDDNTMLRISSIKRDGYLEMCCMDADDGVHNKESKND